MPDIKKKELEVLSKHFENLVQDFTSNDKINLSRDKIYLTYSINFAIVYKANNNKNNSLNNGFNQYEFLSLIL